MNAKQKLHQAKLSQWASHFKEQASSGLTVKVWCTQNNISIHTYNYWKHQLKLEYIDSVLPDIVPLTDCLPVPCGSPMTTADSLPCSGNSRDSRESNHADNEINISVGDIRITIGPSVSEELLFKVLKAVRHA